MHPKIDRPCSLVVEAKVCSVRLLLTSEARLTRPRTLGRTSLPKLRGSSSNQRPAQRPRLFRLPAVDWNDAKAACSLWTLFCAGSVGWIVGVFYFRCVKATHNRKRGEEEACKGKKNENEQEGSRLSLACVLCRKL